MVYAMAKEQMTRPRTFSLQCGTLGGANASEEVLELARCHLGVEHVRGYGMSEATGVCGFPRGTELGRSGGSGLVSPGAA